jgi:transglutaminase-like putative cysteine protease
MKSTRLVLLAACALALVPVVSSRGGDDAAEAQKLAGEAERLARDKKYDEALAAIRKALEIQPGSDRTLALASEIERRAGRFADGVQHALAAVKINDKVGLYYLLVAANAYGNQDPELALQYCRKVLAMKPGEAGESVYKDARAYEDMLLPKTYTITWNLDPDPRKCAPTPGVLGGEALSVALPKSDLPYQKVAVQVQGAKKFRVVPGEVNDVLRVVPDGTKPFRVVTKVTLRPTSYKAKLEKPSGPPARDAAAFLGSSEFFDPASPKLRKIAAPLKGKDSAETVRNVLAWMQKNIAYKLQDKSIVKLDFKNVDEIVDRGHAECKGYTMLFAALCRSAGVPARPVWGVLFASGGFASHSWDEVYVPGAGWVPVDPQKPETFGWLPLTHVRVFMDLRKSEKTQENLPLYNLLYMNGEKLQFEESRAETGSGGK